MRFQVVIPDFSVMPIYTLMWEVRFAFKLCCRLWDHVVSQQDTNISEDLVASIFGVKTFMYLKLVEFQLASTIYICIVLCCSVHCY
jgi:hypothetical protein